MQRHKWIQALCAFGECLEVLEEDDGTHRIRSSGKPAIEVRATADEWQAFISAVKKGTFN
jgi:hypothetical protein